ncbi:hypothetical protein D9C73_019005 [Collichthys lucidus]|uniref:Uncharacterized protein n=1 Tax=Collichthys lucidus TaxID=240159 RepID=A0A4U5V8H2_COLLU|nr:hypothetical protein D9C73_019005 [Collichthys lucidus]
MLWDLPPELVGRFLKPQCSLAPPMQRGRSSEPCSCFSGMCPLHQRRLSSGQEPEGLEDAKLPIMSPGSNSFRMHTTVGFPKVTRPPVASCHGSISSDASAEMEVSALAQSDCSHPRQVTRNQSD